MMSLEEERKVLHSFKEKLSSDDHLSKEELIDMCSQFEDTIDLATVSMKIIDRLRINYTKLQKTT